MREGSLYALADRCLEEAEQASKLFYELLDRSNTRIRELEKQLEESEPKASVLEQETYSVERFLDLASMSIAKVSRQIESIKQEAQS